ncbi:hypothetical protein H0H92_011020 [Tricholoma furcatifolium]|nr:hypothetical protein H0H92_011020 [Tricholoma furcatifolium]
MERAYEYLKSNFNHDSFRGKQEEGLTLVVSPLLSLIKDQVDVLRERGINAANLDSTLHNADLKKWGNTFRPDYLKIARFAEQHRVERVLCLTATATPQAANDICDSFNIDKTSGVFRIPVYRRNLTESIDWDLSRHSLYLQVVAAESLHDKLDYLIPLLQERTGPSIVYVTRQKDTEIVQKRLEPYGIEAAAYHAGLENQERAQIQDQFMASSDGVVICTIAFGMGIDKANIRQIIHLALPRNLEDYSQQVGRAGRDGHPSDCIMFLSSLDVTVLQGVVRGDTPAKEDVESWLKEVLSAKPDEDNTIEFSHYRQADECVPFYLDILFSLMTLRNVLAVSYAWLELQYGYLQTLTPYFTTYQISPRGSGMDSIQNDKSEAAKAIRNNWRHMTRAREEKYERYQVLEESLPLQQGKIDEIVNNFYSRMAKNERSSIAGLHEVIDFATGNACNYLASSLLRLRLTSGSIWQ